MQHGRGLVLDESSYRSYVPSFVAPGRVNLMGDHTDYNDGFVLPLAIDRACTVRVTPPSTNGAITAISHQLDGRVSVPVDGSAEPATGEPPWGRFVAGVVRALTERGITVEPADLDVDTTVPVGSGCRRARHWPSP